MFKKIILGLSCCIANGLLAQAPTDSVREFTIVDSFAWKVNLSIKVPTSVDSAIILISKSPITTLSLTNRVYHIGETVQAGVKVKRKFYSGNNAISFDITSLEANTTYYLSLYTFNNRTSGIFYSTTPIKRTIRTKSGNYGTYYQSLDTNKAVFLSSLTNLLRNHDHIAANYDDFDSLVVKQVYERDTFLRDSSLKYVECSYSGIRAIYAGTFYFPKTNFSREHTLPKDWMNFRGIANPSLHDYPEGADWHNLSLVQTGVNSQRSFYIFKVPHNIKTIGEAKYYENTSNFKDSLNCFEPRNAYKGDAARCIFYMQVCYNKLLDSGWGFKNKLRSAAKYQSQDLLKTWAKSDLPDNLEIARHEYIASIQKNRNPFIDFPDLVDCIDFNDIKLLSGCKGFHIPTPNTGSISSLSDNWDVWYYSYELNKYVLKMWYGEIATLWVTVYDLDGKPVLSEKYRTNDGENSYPLYTDRLSKGQYIIHLETLKHQKNLNLLVE